MARLTVSLLGSFDLKLDNQRVTALVTGKVQHGVTGGPGSHLQLETLISGQCDQRPPLPHCNILKY